MDQSMDVESSKTSESSSTCISPLQFLVEVKNFVRASHSTEYNLLFVSGAIEPNFPNKWDLENNIPPETLWKCFDQVNMLKKLKKYVKLIMELFIIRIETDKEDNLKLMEWNSIFKQLNDCISVFCTKEEYANGLLPVVKSFVDILLKKLRKVDMNDYRKEVFVHNFFQYILKQLFACKTLMNPILEEVIKNCQDVVKIINSQEGSCLSEETVNNIECLNRILNIAEITDRKKLRAIEKDKLQNYKLLLAELMEMDVLPKYILVRVDHVLNMMKNE